MMAYVVRYKTWFQNLNPKPTTYWGIFKREIFVDREADPAEETLIQEFEDEHEARMEAERLFWADPQNSNKFHRGIERGKL